MLKKIFGKKKKPDCLAINPFHTWGPVKPTDNEKRAAKIIHAGGHVEYYYMAIPASKIIEKYPSFILTRPEFFRDPWDTVIRPDEILILGQKYYVVPCQTVKKLRHRMKRSKPGLSIESKFDILVKPGPKVKICNLHVSFFGIRTTNLKSDRGSDSSLYSKKNGKKAELKIGHVDEKKRRIRNENGWEPSLEAIHETFNEIEA